MWLLIGYGAIWSISTCVAVVLLAIWSISRNDAEQEESPHSIGGIVCVGVGIGALVTSIVAMVHLW